MAPAISARHLALSLRDKTISTPVQNRPNTVQAVRGANVIVATEDSPQGRPVSLSRLQQGLDLLFDEGEVLIEPQTFGGYRRSSFIGAALASLPRTEVAANPSRVRLAADSPLRDQLGGVCSLATAPRSSERVSTEDPLQRLLARDLANAVREVLGDAESYKVKGSAGQSTWAETPWLGIFDRLVTETAQSGHYVVFLFESTGERVFLSLNQGVAEARERGRGEYLDLLRTNAQRLASFLPKPEVDDLHLGPIPLRGTGPRTRGYAAGNVAALELAASSLPHDAALLTELRRFLRLYEIATTRLDAEEAPNRGDLPKDAQSGKESRRFRWHLRAEGRNRSAAKKAKQLAGYNCAVCGRNFAEDIGELGKRCIDAHHLTPFSELDERPRDLDPATDFAVVCSNCHRMLHSETPPLTPGDLVAALAAMQTEPGSSPGSD